MSPSKADFFPRPIEGYAWGNSLVSCPKNLKVSCQKAQEDRQPLAATKSRVIVITPINGLGEVGLEPYL